LMVSAADARAVIPRLASMYGEPFADSSQIPTFLVSELARRHVTVALSGDGGDELFAGYDRYGVYRRIDRSLARVPRVARRGASKALLAVSPDRWDSLAAGPLRHVLPQAARRRTGVRAHRLARLLGTTAGGEYADVIAMNPSSHLLLRDQRLADHDPFALTSRLQGLAPTERAMLLDTLAYMPDDILAKVDRASMAVSLEVRVPILDPDVFNFAWRLHPDDRVRNGQGKWVLRRLLHRYVPEAMVERPKMGFGVPVSEWMRGPLRDMVGDLLLSPGVAYGNHIERSMVEQAWRAHQVGLRDYTPLLWCILMFELWARKFLTADASPLETEVGI